MVRTMRIPILAIFLFDAVPIAFADRHPPIFVPATASEPSLRSEGIRIAPDLFFAVKMLKGDIYGTNSGESISPTAILSAATRESFSRDRCCFSTGVTMVVGRTKAIRHMLLVYQFCHDRLEYGKARTDHSFGSCALFNAANWFTSYPPSRGGMGAR
ncbi:hypothetical protein P171DRAFT_15783 [Karstenula rhodostoma CBS 690.94]|uniref:Secreted protein n=1 Tax=Karstenula rhodostoma CBS 690.94 TaxID=1392251 RepID=A0A9P4UK39_9PLEO|nr:hypothetical protein P171DRAFT_15783 [Karstenula rhodostoma CBS 690.94]